MLTDLITHRFTKHHGYLLASMDALEDVGTELDQTLNPGSVMDEQKALLLQIFDFLLENQAQHQREEERILLPILKKQLDRETGAQSIETVRQVCREHRRGRQLIEQAAAGLERLLTDHQRQTTDAYRQFSRSLLELVEHYREHVKTEDLIVFPTARRLVPDDADSLWADDDIPIRNRIA
jgi:hemerythrin-like domain-containing protein